jgi:hypothetical protein
MDQLIEMLGSSRTTIQRELDALRGLNRVARTGKGKSGSPYRFHLVASDESLSAQPKDGRLGRQTSGAH